MLSPVWLRIVSFDSVPHFADLSLLANSERSNFSSGDTHFRS